MKIDIILPFKEIFSSDKASAVSLTVKNSAEFSRYKKSITVFGQYIENPFVDLNFIGLKTNRFLHLGNNRSLLINYLKVNINKTTEKKIIEMHNRPYLFNLAINKNIKHPITLHFHNDPRTMKGSKTIAQRIYIAKNASAVYFVSKYIMNCFLEGIDNAYNNLHVLPNGIQRTLLKRPIKKKLVLFIGRLVKEKGCHLFVDALAEIIKDFPDWKFKIIGTPKAGQNKLNELYVKETVKKFLNLGPNTEYLGFVSNTEVKKVLEQTSLLIVPSIWQEPFALTALEGMCNGAAVIASKVGGMSEMLIDSGYLINSINKDKLKKAINLLLSDSQLLNKYQNKSWNNYRYNQTDIVSLQDKYRDNILKLIDSYN